MTPTFSILVNSCDKFEDCWNPFFQLFARYWPDCHYPIYLNTEYKDYHFPNLPVIPLQCCKGNAISANTSPTWSQCLLWALESIPTDIVLYLQEDYFLTAPVNNELFEQFLQLFQTHPSMHCLHLSDGVAEGEPSSYNHVSLIPRKYDYRVSCQAAFWRREILMSYLKESESAWQFEEFASARARFIPHNFYCVSHSFLRNNDFFPYLKTGVIQGRWWEPVVPLFRDNAIEVDFSTRGFVGEKYSKPLTKRIAYRWNKIKKYFSHYPELWHLRRKYGALQDIEYPSHN